MTAIFVREVRSAFSGMMGWLLTAFLTAASGLYFMANNLGFGLTDFGYYTLYQTSFVLLVYVPVLTMRSLAGERHARTDQLLLTSPVPVWGIVLGKYFAMCAVFRAALPGRRGHDPGAEGDGLHQYRAGRQFCQPAGLLPAGLRGHRPLRMDLGPDRKPDRGGGCWALRPCFTLR